VRRFDGGNSVQPAGVHGNDMEHTCHGLEANRR
jgi:hypothetical protein